MKKFSFSSLLIFLLLSFTLTGCDLIVGIFEAGFWTAVILLLVVVGIVIWLIGKFLG
ncbi:MAG: hypothetical protein ACLFUB_15620 [Cyclobacteriaceae bacterium]